MMGGMDKAKRYGEGAVGYTNVTQEDYVMAEHKHGRDVERDEELEKAPDEELVTATATVEVPAPKEEDAVDPAADDEPAPDADRTPDAGEDDEEEEKAPASA